MMISWLGQGGLYIDSGSLRVLIDPYLSDSLHEMYGESMRRLIPVDPAYLQVEPDVIVLTHDHLDHTDMPVLQEYLNTNRSITVLASRNAFKEVKAACGGSHNYVLFDRGTWWSQGGICFKAVTAVHSDEFAVGVQMLSPEWNIYLTGDTLCSDAVAASVTPEVDLMFTVMNGRGNNMNATDAAYLTRCINPKAVVPIHWGMLPGPSDTPEAFAEQLKGSGIVVHRPSFFEATPFGDFLKSNL